MSHSTHLLLLGAGSVGRRHLRNFTALGCRVSAFDPRDDRLAEARAEVTLEGEFTDQAEALAAARYDGIVVASPPNVHVDQCIAALESGVPVLLEKPVAPTHADAARLAEAVRAPGAPPLLLGYTYRWWVPLGRLRELVAAGKVGTPLHARFVMSAHLADWHPWERYQDFFMASKELGGGALLDESHFIDLMLWFFGRPERVVATVEKLSDLEIETDDNVDMIAVYPGGLRVTMHLDLFGRPHEKYIVIAGDGGTLQWSFDPNRVRFSDRAEGAWEDEEWDLERNDMFVGVANEFLSVIAGETEPSCTAGDGADVLAVVEACRESTESRCFVDVEYRG